jgi:type IV pilus assembly protein PilA
MLLSKIQQRLRNDERGFTLIELLIVLVIIGILLAIAVPSYLGFKDRANQKAAAANVRAAIPSAEAYYSDNGNYTNMNITTGDAPNAGGLQGIDSGLKLTKVTSTATTYQLCSQVGNKASLVNGPGGTVSDVPGGTCP